MQGQGRTGELDVSRLNLPDNVRFVDASGSTQRLKGDTFGPELSLAENLAAAMPERVIVLVKHAVGGTSLLAWAPEWDSLRAEQTGNAASGPLYDTLMDVLVGADLPLDRELGAVFWMQGERDARFDVGSQYFANLSTLVAAFRADLQAPSLPFILGIVNPPPESYPTADAVRAAQTRAAAELPHVHLIETDDLSKWPDRLHYDTEGVLALGRRFASVFLDAYPHERR